MVKHKKIDDAFFKRKVSNKDEIFIASIQLQRLLISYTKQNNSYSGYALFAKIYSLFGIYELI